ncbi:MAG: aspartate 1-decarboxylase [Leptospiraceae bacterium]|nr:aspartate 1-decarboxylase [Leptospiraceae bacterium]MDW7976955.1 aspartate 1-decarboxylase [Leptospiraceae bacterium]
MFIEMFRAKIHRATVTEANLHYEGSLTIDEELLEASGIKPYERVSVVNIHNGARFDTYVIKGEKGKGEICLNGAAARLGEPGDKVIIIAYALMKFDEIPKDYQPIVVHVDDNNRIVKITGKS